MILHRIKTELRENRRLLAIYWLCLGISIISHLLWWFGEVHPNGSAAPSSVSILSIAGLAITSILLAFTTFKRDDLKSAVDFNATRPIRPRTVFGVKLAFCWGMLALPAGLMVATIGIITGNVQAGLVSGMETSVWIGFTCSLIALSCMNHAGWNRLYIISGAIILGLVVGYLLIDSSLMPQPLIDLMGRSRSGMHTLLLLLVIATAIVSVLCIRQIQNKNSTLKFWHISVGTTIVFLASFLVPLDYTISPSKHIKTTLTVVASSHTEATDLYRDVANGAPYVAGSLVTGLARWPDDQPIPNMDSYHYEKLRTPDFDMPWLKFRIEYLSPIGPHQTTTDPRSAFLRLGFQISQSAQSDDDIYWDVFKGRNVIKPLDSLPKRKIRVVGEYHITKKHDKEVARLPFAQQGSLRENGLRLEWRPDFANRQWGQSYLDIKKFSPCLLSNAHGMHLIGDYSIHMDHPLHNEPVNMIAFLQSTRSKDNFLMHTRSSDYSTHESKFEFMRRPNHSLPGDQHDFKDWIQRASLVVNVTDRIETIIVPIDLEVEIPDPQIIHEMLKRGEL